MPITKQVIKRVRQAKKRTDRNRHYRSDMKSMVRLVLEYAEKNELDKATKILPKVVKAIDSAAKRNIIHKNNAAHKKSRVQLAVNRLQKGSEKKEENKEEAKA